MTVEDESIFWLCHHSIDHSFTYSWTLSSTTYGWKATKPRKRSAKLSHIQATNDNILISHKANKCPFCAQTKVCTLSSTQPNIHGETVCIGLERWVNCNVKLHNMKMRTSAVGNSRENETGESNALNKFSAHRRLDRAATNGMTRDRNPGSAVHSRWLPFH